MTQDMIRNKIDQMTTDEKIDICIGKDFWHVNGLERLGIEETAVSDGPHGLRKQENEQDHLGLNESKMAICYPAGCALACSFDVALAEKQGKILGKEAQTEGLSVVLGPAMNLKRSPLCGRNFEYYSEDPVHSGKMAAGMIRGMQQEGIGACPKHFLANNQEKYRFTSNSVVDERTMRELYLKNFEYAVKEGRPWTIMGSYNRVNGTYACENKKYLTDILRGEWKFDGYTVTDWGACNDAVEGLKAGMDLIMPGPASANKEELKKAIETGKLTEKQLNVAVEHILNVVLRYQENKVEDTEFDFEWAHEQAGKIAAESAVLLKNESKVLPLHREDRIAVIGEFARNPRFQGGGSSHIKPYKSTGALELLEKYASQISYAGFEDGVEKITEAVKNADKVIIFAGVPEEQESEGVDRVTMSIPDRQEQIIYEAARENENVIVVLHNGSAVTMQWIENVKAVLEMYLGGEAVGMAAADLLYGNVNPSGRLAETFPMAMEDTPVFPYYGVENDDVIYREGVFIGYRYYERMRKNILFPFGYGLSYTEFRYDNLRTDKQEILDSDRLQVFVDVENIGDCEGKEVVQLYIQPPEHEIISPVRELKAFTKTDLKSHEKTTIVFEIDKEAFAYWDTKIHDWNVESGRYKIQICKNATEVLLQTEVYVKSSQKKQPKFTINTPIGEIMKYEKNRVVINDFIMELFGTENKEKSELPAVESFLKEMPLRALLTFSNGTNREELEKIVDDINKTGEE